MHAFDGLVILNVMPPMCNPIDLGYCPWIFSSSFHGKYGLHANGTVALFIDKGRKKKNQSPLSRSTWRFVMGTNLAINEKQFHPDISWRVCVSFRPSSTLSQHQTGCAWSSIIPEFKDILGKEEWMKVFRRQDFLVSLMNLHFMHTYKTPLIIDLPFSLAKCWRFTAREKLTSPKNNACPVCFQKNAARSISIRDNIHFTFQIAKQKVQPCVNHVVKGMCVYAQSWY